MSMQEFLMLDLPVLLTAVLACAVCSLIGTFLVLRRQALMGDAVSHVVLPGIVAAFAITGTLAPFATMAGALVAALISIAAIELLRNLGRLEAGAAMGTVFTVMFAIGVGMLEWTGGGQGHLDVRHALFGSLETVLWIPAGQLDAVPRQITTLAGVAVVLTTLCILFYKELAVCTFDPGLATVLGLRPRLIGAGLVTATGIAAVAAFEAVGSILVIAMFVGPPCVARMLTDRLSTQIWLSILIAVVSGTAGYGAGAFGPALFGSPYALNIAGMIAVVAGVLQVLAMLFAPRYGVLSRRRRGQSIHSATI